MSRFEARDPLDRIFEIRIILKGLDGVLEASAAFSCWRSLRQRSTA